MILFTSYDIDMFQMQNMHMSMKDPIHRFTRHLVELCLISFVPQKVTYTNVTMNQLTLCLVYQSHIIGKFDIRKHFFFMKIFAQFFWNL